MRGRGVSVDTFCDVVDDALVHLAACDKRQSRADVQFSREQIFLVWPGSPSDWKFQLQRFSPREVEQVRLAGTMLGYQHPRWLQPFGTINKGDGTLSLSAAESIVALEAEEDGDGLRISPYFIRQARILNPREVAWRRFGEGHKYVAELLVASPTPMGTYASALIYAWWNGSEWIPTGEHNSNYTLVERRPEAGGRTWIDASISAALSFAEARLSWWMARFKLDGASLDLPTDPSGARALFADRNTYTKGRREAIRHWVTSHSRSVRRGESSDVTWVRAHLRGRSEFSWNGLAVELVPSVHDMRASELGLSPIEYARITEVHS